MTGPSPSAAIHNLKTREGESETAEPQTETELFLAQRRNEMNGYAASVSELDISIAMTRQRIREAEAELADQVSRRDELVRLRQATEQAVHQMVAEQ